MKKCRLHPKYVGTGKPTSKKTGCTCLAIWRTASKAVASKPEPKVPKVETHFREWGSPEIIEGADKLIEAVMARKDPALHRTRAPAGAALRGASTLNRINEDGTVTSVLQWVKTKDAMDPEMLVEIVRGAVLANPIPPAKNVAKTAVTSQDLEVVLGLGDPHFGMLAWDKETGDDWDVEIARKVHTGAIREAIRISPASSRLVIINLGDAAHADGNTATTTAGTRVDVDSRWPKVVGIFVETMNLAIIAGLEKHDHVEMVNIRGNHDDLTALVIAMIMQERWRDNPRVTVASNLQMIWYHKFGRNLLAATHGDKAKMAQLPAIVAHDARKHWGETDRTHVYCGHVHHHRTQEYPGIEIEYLNTLASKDSWHANQGYRSRRSLRCDVWHREQGLITKHELSAEQFV